MSTIPVRRRDMRRQLTEARLLTAGLEELTESSDSELTIRGVALRAGVSPANAYKYFSSKNSLIAAIYLDLLRNLPPHNDVNISTERRVLATLNDMAAVVAGKPALASACASALIANEVAAEPFRVQIAAEVTERIATSLGPGWPATVHESVKLAYYGALIAARFERFDQVAAQLGGAIGLILDTHE